MKQQNFWLKITFQPDMSEGAQCQNSLSKHKCGPERPSNTNEPETLMVGTPSTNIRKRNCLRRLISACGNTTRGTLAGYLGVLCAGNKSRAQIRDEECEIKLLLFSRSVRSNSLRPHKLQHAGLPGPSPSPGVCSDSCPLSQ